MGTLLESEIKSRVAAAFKGKLLTCTLRRVATTSLDSRGDVSASSVTTYSFDGFRDTFSAMFAAQAGIPVTDARILIIAGSLTVTPVKDDQVKVGGDWFQLRQLTARDPAGATFEFAGFQIADPTA